MKKETRNLIDAFRHLRALEAIASPDNARVRAVCIRLQLRVALSECRNSWELWAFIRVYMLFENARL